MPIERFPFKVEKSICSLGITALLLALCGSSIRAVRRIWNRILSAGRMSPLSALCSQDADGFSCCRHGSGPRGHIGEIKKGPPPHTRTRKHTQTHTHTYTEEWEIRSQIDDVRWHSFAESDVPSHFSLERWYPKTFLCLGVSLHNILC